MDSSRNVDNSSKVGLAEPLGGGNLLRPLPGVPAFDSPFYGYDGFEHPIRPEHRKVAQDLRDNGYAVIDFPDPAFDQRAADIRAALNDQFDWANWRNGGYERNEGLRIQDAWKTNNDVGSIASNAQILDLLSDVFGREAKPFQTLNFPVGTQQQCHSDASHFSSVPEKFVCGVWVALEDITADAGPLIYYPGTHKLPLYSNEHLGVTALDWGKGSAYDATWVQLIAAQGLKSEKFLARKGQALIWVSNILHGGSRQTNPDSTRWSQVTHYYFDQCAYYTPFFSDPFHGNILFRSPIDIRTGEAMQNIVGREPVASAFVNEATDRAHAMASGKRMSYETRLAEAQAEIAYHKGRVDRLKASLSWRITAPLRSIGRARSRA